ncbi:MAG: TadE/TadG family type IV pilus assembly protein [Vulcanimicrobiaceae bacterium]
MGRREFQRGGIMLEFAVVAPIFFLMIFAIFDFGAALYQYGLVDNAARLGSRYAIVRGSGCLPALSGCPATNANVQSYVVSQSPGIDQNTLHVTTTWPGGNPGCTSTNPPYNGAGCAVTVTANYTFHFMLLAGYLPLNMSSTSSMVISQ